MRFQVPQFIEVEDKIFGPLTIKQFTYVAGGAGLAFILYTLLPFYIFLIVAAPILGLAGALAFYRVNNQPFVVILEAVVNYLTKPRLYLWQKAKKQATPSAAPKSASALRVPGSSEKLKELSWSLDVQHGDPVEDSDDKAL